MKNGFFHSHLRCTSNSAVIDEAEQQEIISQKRSFDSNESSSSMRNDQQRRYVSLSELNQSVEVVLVKAAAAETTGTATPATPVIRKSYNVVDLDDEVSSDNSGSKRCDLHNHECHENYDDTEGKNGDHGVPDAADEGDIVSVPANKEAISELWSRIAKQLEDEIAQGIVPLSTEVVEEVAAVIADDERTQGSDNSKCSFGYEKPIIKETSKNKNKSKKSKEVVLSKADHQEEVLKSLYVEENQPVFDKIPSKLLGTMMALDNDEQFDNTTCTWSESAESTIPTVIYIRRDVPPAVPDDEALGQNYTPQQLKAIYDYTNRINDTTTTTTTTTSKSYLMKGLRFLTLGAIGSSSNNTNYNSMTTTTPLSSKLKKIHLDDDASEAFHQTLIDI